MVGEKELMVVCEKQAGIWGPQFSSSGEEGGFTTGDCGLAGSELTCTCVGSGGTASLGLTVEASFMMNQVDSSSFEDNKDDDKKPKKMISRLSQQDSRIKRSLI